MARKSLVMQALMFVVDFFSALFKELKKQNVTEEQIFDALKSKNNLIPQMAGMIAGLIVAGTNGAKGLALKSLRQLIAAFRVANAPFPKHSFFMKTGPVKLYFGDSFADWVLKEIPETIEAFQGNLMKTQLTEYMYDSAILNELGQPRPFTAGEFAVIIRDLLTRQPNGEDGILLTNGYANIFYIRLEDSRVVAVRVRWGSGFRVWDLNAIGLDDDRWDDGSCVFSRS